MPAPGLERFQVSERAVPGALEGGSAWGVGVVGSQQGPGHEGTDSSWDGVLSRPRALMALFTGLQVLLQSEGWAVPS